MACVPILRPWWGSAKERLSRLPDHGLSPRDDWALFTGRWSNPIDIEAARSTLTGKRVLITGAGGYIASALIKALACIDLSDLILLDIVEAGLHQLYLDLRLVPARPPTRFVVGSVQDSDLLREIATRHNPQIVIHAAACKHVPLMEANPFMAASTNVLGTQQIVKAAIASGAEQCVLLSTDKAVDPASIMGATKRIAELVMIGQHGHTHTKVLRLGNVLGSSGSVVPFFLQQIAGGGPVTVSDPEANRYFLSVNEAVQHLLTAVSTDIACAILIPDITEPHRIYDLAKFLIAKEAGAASEQVQIVFTGLRPGDKLAERMLAPAESLAPAGLNGGLHRVITRAASSSVLAHCLTEIKDALRERDLNRLLQAIQIAVPEYVPSALLQSELSQDQNVHST